MLQGIPLTYDRDMQVIDKKYLFFRMGMCSDFGVLQEDKEQLFDALDTVFLVLGCYSGMMASIRPNADVMFRAAANPGL